jgi:hypothetical protein
MSIYTPVMLGEREREELYWAYDDLSRVLSLTHFGEESTWKRSNAKKLRKKLKNYDT